MQMARIKLLKLEDLPDILTPQHVADYMGIARQRVYEFCQCGELKSYKIGASRKIDKSEMQLLLERIRGHKEEGR